MRSVFLLILATLCSPLFVSAQQDPQFSMYMFNRMVLNPAYAGARGATNITTVGRSQWVGIDGHPNTFTLSADAPLRVLHGGIGGHLMVDQIGPISTIGAKLAYAYRFNLGQAPANGIGSALQIGITGGFWRKQLDATRLLPEQQNDPVLMNLIASGENNKTTPDLGAGVYFNTRDEKFFAGVSANHLTEPVLWTSGTTLPRTFMGMAGYRIGQLNAINLVPSVNFRMAGSQAQLDVNANLHVAPMVFGISYRGLSNFSDLVAIVGFQANQRFFLGYSYDYTFSQLQGSTSGSHEILLSYTFPRIFRFFPEDLDTMDNPLVR